MSRRGALSLVVGITTLFMHISTLHALFFRSFINEALKSNIQRGIIAGSASVALIFANGIDVEALDLKSGVMERSSIFISKDLGANDAANSKIRKGGASTLQQGITKAITRGVNLDNSDFSGQNLKGVAFQQSIVRESNFRDANLYSASFFDATLDGSDFENADLTLANVELAQFNRVNFKNAVMRQMYVVGTTRFEGVKSIENTDWTDTELRNDQRKYLCSLPTAKGVNPKTQVDTRESLLCDLFQ